MRIAGQRFEVTDRYLILRLNDPYWSAWQRFGWPQDTEGYSVNEEAIKKAMELKKKILVKNKYGDYEITPTKALKHGRGLTASNGTPLICIPKYAFDKLPEPIDESANVSFDIKARLAEEFFKKHPELRRKRA